jgi:glycerol-3-phosphate acyltransferase PlsY
LADGFGAGAGEVLLAALAGYLAGSIPFGLLLTRIAGVGDLRRVGSGNIGATNVLRAGGKGLAALTFLCDCAKGALPVLLATVLWPAPASLVAGIGAVVGHDFPLWLGLRGGKGVSTTLGVLTALAWPVGLLTGAIWIAAAVLFRYSSLAALIALAAAPLLMLTVADRPRALTAGLLTVLAFVRHHQNIRRLLNGNEPKIGASAADAPPP